MELSRVPGLFHCLDLSLQRFGLSIVHSRELCNIQISDVCSPCPCKEKKKALFGVLIDPEISMTLTVLHLFAALSLFETGSCPAHYKMNITKLAGCNEV